MSDNRRASINVWLSAVGSPPERPGFVPTDKGLAEFVRPEGEWVDMQGKRLEPQPLRWCEVPSPPDMNDPLTVEDLRDVLDFTLTMVGTQHGAISSHTDLPTASCEPWRRSDTGRCSRTPTCAGSAAPSSTELTMPDAFRFHMRRLAVDGTRYYYPNWNRAVPISVVAATQADALEKAQAMSGQPTRHGFVWRFVVDRIEEVAPDA